MGRKGRTAAAAAAAAALNIANNLFGIKVDSETFV